MWTYLADRFGVARADLAGFELVRRSGDFWLVSAATDPARDAETMGIRFVRDQEIGFKPTTYALQFLGDAVADARVQVDRTELLRLLEGGTVDRDVSDGYVALVYDDRIAGCGLSRRGTVESMIPKGRAQELQEILEEKEGEKRGLG
ncbi:MAG: hypothetical protein ABEK12_03165 [Candidatus Nanohaloarchaea archaeon]